MFPSTEIAAKIAVALGIGLLVGLEREWARKDVGVRTFALTALLGMLSSLVTSAFALVTLVGVLLLVGYLNLRSVLRDRSLEITTSVALIVTMVLGVLVGNGHLYTPVASAVVMTLLLSWKSELSEFAEDLSPEEIRSAVLMGLLGFVIYPILPDRFIDRWQLINPRQTWVTVIVLAGIGFINYVLLRIYRTRGMYYTAVLGGLVNSTATVAQLSSALTRSGSYMPPLTTAVVLLTIAAMFVRNLAILTVFAPHAAATALWPLVVMTVMALTIVWLRRYKSRGATTEFGLTSPVSLRRVLMFGAVFLAIEVAGSLAQRYLGRFGFLMVSFAGGLVSSASTTAAGALMAAHGRLQPDMAGVAAVLASIASALVNLPLVYQQTRQKALIRTLSAICFALVFAGLLVLLIRERSLR